MAKFPAKLREKLLDDHVLFKQVVTNKILLAAWSRVWSNGGCSGGDNLTLVNFQRGVNSRLFKLANDLRNGDYVPGPLRHVKIPKKGGGERVLAIPCVIDRVAQTAVNEILMPLLDEEFEDSSFGYRRGRSVKQAVMAVSKLQRGGAAWVVDADIKGFFENVPHEKLLDRLAQSMSQGPLTELISLWLEHGGNMGRGLPQGGSLSPLLANLYLDRLDEAFEKRGARIVRYADDFVILCENAPNAQKALEKVKNLLDDYGLEINEEKTQTVSFDKGFRFLGHLFVRSLVVQSTFVHEQNQMLQLMQKVARDDEKESEEAELAKEQLLRKKRAGLDPGLRVLYVMEAGRRLHIRNEAFSVEERLGNPQEGYEWCEILALPNKDVDRIEIGTKAQASQCAIELALASDTPVAFVDGWGKTKGWVAPCFGDNPKRHLAQAKVIFDENKRLDLARNFVNGRLRNQRALLRRLNRTRKNKEILKSLAKMNILIRRVPHENSLAQLMGIEGRATALYWPAIGKCLNNGFEFSKRDRKGEISGVNILFNMSANMLARDVTICLERAGLHIGFGVLHETYGKRDALAYDLMEEFRASLCESVVVSAINCGAISLEMFNQQKNGKVRITANATRALIRAYERAASRPVKSQRTGKRRMWRHIITEQAFLLANHFEGKEQYKPYIMDY